MNRRVYLVVTLLIVTIFSFRVQLLVATPPSPYLQQKHATSLSRIAAESIKVDVDWSTVIREIPSYAYGVNSSANFIPDYSKDPVFMNNLKMITQQKGFIRLHGWGMLEDNSPEAWQENGIWDSTKINQALRPLVDEGYTVMINVPSGPSGEHDYADPVRFAQFCADLVKIVNIDHQLGVQYWEIPNERESGFADPGLSVSEMATLFQTARQAMKAVDPSIKVGGPAAAWVNIDYVTELVKNLYPDIDFLSMHTYSGDGLNNVSNAYDIAQYAISDLSKVRANINSITGNQYLPIFLTEHNISYQGSPRIQTHHGAVYDAIILTGSIMSGADASMYWNVAPYSDMSVLDGDIADENAHLFESFNQSFYGDLVKSQSSDSSKVIIYSVNHPTKAGEHAFALINRSEDPQAIHLDFEHWQPSALSWTLWDDNNAYTKQDTNWSELNQGSFTLSAFSVNLFVSQKDQPSDDSSNSGGGALPVQLLFFFLMVLFCRARFLAGCY